MSFFSTFMVKLMRPLHIVLTGDGLEWAPTMVEYEKERLNGNIMFTKEAPRDKRNDMTDGYQHETDFRLNFGGHE